MLPEYTPDPPTVSKRKAWLAGLLALLWGPLALVYCGRLARAIAWVAVSFLLGLIGVACMLYLPVGRLAVYGGSALIVLPQVLLIIDAVLIARGSGPDVRRSYQRVWIYVVLAVVVWAWSAVLQTGFRRYWSEAFYMPTRSMADTLLPGDRFMVDKLILRYREPRRGEIVAHRAADGVVYCRRIIGLPGDIVEIRDEKAYLNEVLLRESYAKLEGEWPLPDSMVNSGPLTVPQGQAYMLGDHRRRSKDSRLDGPYPLDGIVGVARIVFWSREYTESPPQQPLQEPGVEWGEVRWDRIGNRLDEGF